MRKKGENVSGDRGTYFKTDAGVLCVILSDGMGTGEDAAAESVEAVQILERFLAPRRARNGDEDTQLRHAPAQRGRMGLCDR